MKMNMTKQVSILRSIGLMVFTLTVAVTTQIQAMEADAPATTAIGMYNQISDGWRNLGDVEKTNTPKKDHVVAGNFCNVIQLLPFNPVNRDVVLSDNLTLELCLGIIANFESNAEGITKNKTNNKDDGTNFTIGDLIKIKKFNSQKSYNDFIKLYKNFGITKTIPNHDEMDSNLADFRKNYSRDDNEGEGKKLNAFRLFLAIDFAALRYMCEEDMDPDNNKYLNILYKAIELQGSIK